jgi:divalent metal cation (Fe/Co/Zn/Cd) transporter
VVSDRVQLVKRGRRLEYFTILWNSLEAVAALISGLIAGSVALMGFGLDSCVEVASGAALLWRLRQDTDLASRERAERLTLRMVGLCFLLLSAYVTYESVSSLIARHSPQKSPVGIAIALASLVAMPLLSRAKRRISAGIGSAAMAADARQTDFCAYLSGILLGGLLLNALFGLWWADPAAGLIMVPIIVKEGLAGLQGKSCCDSCGD